MAEHGTVSIRGSCGFVLVGKTGVIAPSSRLMLIANALSESRLRSGHIDGRLASLIQSARIYGNK
jgi:hypothetical protein